MADAKYDPAHNPLRPKWSPKTATEIPDLSALFPNQVRRDPELFSRVNKELFASYGSKRGWAPASRNKNGGIDTEPRFFCTQDSMFLIQRTTEFEAFNTIDHSDFALNDPNCNVASNNMAWFAVNAPTISTWEGQTEFEEQIQGANGIVCNPGDNCDTIEYVAAIIPLDGCGSTAEMEQHINPATNKTEDYVVFKNRVRNGAYSTIHQQDTHNGITLDSAVDFTVQCMYLATYELAQSSIEAQAAGLHDKQSQNADEQLKVELNFMETRAAADVDTVEVEGNIYGPVTGLHSVQVGETAVALVNLDRPNNLITMQVTRCALQNQVTTTRTLEFPFIDNMCPVAYTNTRLIDEPGGRNSSALVTFTMFEFVDPELETVSVQKNYLKCNVRICLRETGCPEECTEPNN